MTANGHTLVTSHLRYTVPSPSTGTSATRRRIGSNRTEVTAVAGIFGEFTYGLCMFLWEKWGSTIFWGGKIMINEFDH